VQGSGYDPKHLKKQTTTTTTTTTTKQLTAEMKLYPLLWMSPISPTPAPVNLHSTLYL
jgi:hypothetical protein